MRCASRRKRFRRGARASILQTDVNRKRKASCTSATILAANPRRASRAGSRSGKIQCTANRQLRNIGQGVAGDEDERAARLRRAAAFGAGAHP